MPGSIPRSVGSMDHVRASGVPRLHCETITYLEFQAGAGVHNFPALANWASKDLVVLDVYIMLDTVFSGGGCTSATLDVGVSGGDTDIFLDGVDVKTISGYGGMTAAKKGAGLSDARTMLALLTDTLCATLIVPDGGGVGGLTQGSVDIWFWVVEVAEMP